MGHLVSFNTVLPQTVLQHFNTVLLQTVAQQFNTTNCGTTVQHHKLWHNSSNSSTPQTVAQQFNMLLLQTAVQQLLLLQFNTMLPHTAVQQFNTVLLLTVLTMGTYFTHLHQKCKGFSTENAPALCKSTREPSKKADWFWDSNSGHSLHWICWWVS